MDSSPVDDTTELVLTQHVAAPIGDVWAAWTTAEGLARWWWPHWPDTIYTMQATAGGSWSARSEQGKSGVAGEVLRLDQPNALELTWRWDGADVEDLVRIELTETAGGTSVTVRHRTQARGMENYRLGWEYVLGGLHAALDVGPRVNAFATDHERTGASRGFESTSGT